MSFSEQIDCLRKGGTGETGWIEAITLSPVSKDCSYNLRETRYHPGAFRAVYPVALTEFRITTRARPTRCHMLEAHSSVNLQPLLANSCGQRT